MCRETRIAANTTRIGELTTLIAADEAELVTLDPAADAARIAFLGGRIAAREGAVSALTTRNAEMAAIKAEQAIRITELTTRNAELAALITAHETRIDELTAINEDLAVLREDHVTRITELTTRNDELEALIIAHEERISFLSDRNMVLAGQLAGFEADLIEAQGNCDPVTAEGLYYLHADHLGRPQFATDTGGNVVWDMGEGVTPFGDSVNLAGAFAQQLMFPGQYADLETGGQGDDVTLSHNWHRTYDPTLGRYLQSDPIGLAGGLNRYAYVGGNPVGAVDPMGLDGILTIHNNDDPDGWGHAWITYQPLGPSVENGCGCEEGGAQEAYGTYPGGSGFSGIFSGDVRTGARAYGSNTPNSSRSMYINDSGERNLYSMIRAYQSQNGKLAWLPVNACTGFATQTWRAATGEDLHALNLFGISSTSALGHSIGKANERDGRSGFNRRNSGLK